MEAIEERKLLTATLYIDYGDRFAGGVLNTTVGDIHSHTLGSNPNIDGPTLSDSAGNNYSSGTSVAIRSLNNLYGAAAAAMRATMDALVQRFYQGLDITVVDLTATPQTVNGHSVQAAASLDDISATLGVNEGDAKNNDSYVIVGQYTINGTDNPAVFATNGYGGLSTGTDIGGNNNNDGTALVLLIGSGDSTTFNGPQIAHESGHAFGLRHVYRQNTGSPAPAITNTTATGAQYDRLHQSELMSYLGYATQGGFNVFSRYPMMKGDGNTDANTLSTTPTPFDHFINDPNIGPSGIEYITGTGENDIITVTNAGGGLANVSVQAFDDTNYTTTVDAPGATGNTYSYTIQLNKPLVIDAGGRNDRIVLDGDLGVNITVRGMQGTDTLVVNGKNAANATCTSGTNNTNGLDGNSDLRGSIALGATVINFQEFEAASSVTVQNVTNLVFSTGGSSDTITMASPAAGQNRITGASDGVTVVPLLFTNVSNFTIDTATNDGALPVDRVTLAASGLATGLQQITVNTGAGDDRLDVNFAPGNPIPTNGLTFNGGTGSGDLLSLFGGSFTNEVYTATGPGSGTINLDGSIISYLNLAPIDDIVPVTNMTFNATAGNDLINLVNGPVLSATQTAQINSGNATFERVNFANKTNVEINGQNGADTITHDATVLPAGLATLVLNGEDGANAGDDNSADTLNINTTLSGVATTGTGGGGADVFNVVGSGLAATSTLSLAGQAGDDQFNVTSSADVAVNVDGGVHTLGDTLAVNGETLDYTITASVFNTTGRQPINYLNVENLNLANGTFGVSGTIAPNVNVNLDAKLYGTGTVQGSVTANSNGVVSPGLVTGSSTGILNTGNVALAATSTYQVQVNGLADGTEHDVLNVAGTVNLGGANLDLTAGLTFVPGDEVLIVRNDGADPIVGKFAQGDMITIGSQKFAIDYAYDGDGDGNLNDVALIRYGAALAPDPCDPTKQALFVSATTGADNIRLYSDQGNPRIHVLINNDDFGVFEPTGLLIAFGQAGNDTVKVEVPSRRSWLYGQNGQDTLIAGNNDSVLIGGLGDDHLIGGNGKDLLVGGKGADLIEGGNGDDALISGSFKYETNNAANRAAICGIQDEWTGGGSLSTRIANLTNGGGKNGSAVLNSSTVFDDTSIDTVLGQNGPDWLILNTTGSGVLDVSDAAKPDAVTDI